jgi:hypothetical protein
MRQLSDYLFMGSLILLIVTFVFKGFLSNGFSGVSRSVEQINIDLHMEEHNKNIARQDSFIPKILKSIPFWISIAGILASILISKL